MVSLAKRTAIGTVFVNIWLIVARMNSDTSTSCNCGLQSKVWLGRAEVADRLGVAVATLAGWAVQGIGPKHVVIGKFARYHIEDLEQWEKRLRHGGAAPGDTAA